VLVITLTNCPPSLRGDLTGWLFEINTGVYVGNVSARVRDELWKRICENIKTGNVTMVYSAANEQHLDFRVYNTSWQPIDFDGLKLMLRPSATQKIENMQLRQGFSKAAKKQIIKQMSRSKAKKKENAHSKAAKKQIIKQMSRSKAKKKENAHPSKYIVLDIETTGLSISDDEIIEIGALLVENTKIIDMFNTLIRSSKPVPSKIKELTGISDEMLREKGRDISDVLPELLSFVGELPIVSHNPSFDYGFLREYCKRFSLPLLSNRCIDTIALARRQVRDVSNYKLTTLAEYFGISIESSHRCVADCKMTKLIYEKLIDFD